MVFAIRLCVIRSDGTDTIETYILLYRRSAHEWHHLNLRDGLVGAGFWCPSYKSLVVQFKRLPISDLAINCVCMIVNELMILPSIFIGYFWILFTIELTLTPHIISALFSRTSYLLPISSWQIRIPEINRILCYEKKKNLYSGVFRHQHQHECRPSGMNVCLRSKKKKKRFGSRNCGYQLFFVNVADVVSTDDFRVHSLNL